MNEQIKHEVELELARLALVLQKNIKSTFLKRQSRFKNYNKNKLTSIREKLQKKKLISLFRIYFFLDFYYFFFIKIFKKKKENKKRKYFKNQVSSMRKQKY